MKYLLLLILFIPNKESPKADSLAFDYNEMLNRHSAYGHIDKKDLKFQKEQLAKDQDWQKEFSEQVRGVASSINSSEKIIDLSNPTIEIPVK